MQTVHHRRLRVGAFGLGLSAFLLMVFPLARPFFRMNVFAPEETIAAASPAFASVAWVFAHYLATLGFVLLPGGMLALYVIHAGTEAEPRAFRGLVWGIMGTALVLPILGVEVFAMPVIGRLHLDGATGLAPAITLIYWGPMTVVLLVGLVFLAVGAFNFAFAIRHSRLLPVWAAFVFVVGLALWPPLLPKPVRIVDGLLIGLGGTTLASSLWRKA